MRGPERVNVLGTGVSVVDFDGAIQTMDGWIEQQRGNFVCVTSVHGIVESMRDEELRAIHNRAGMVTPDGISAVWYSRVKGKRGLQRVCGPDLFPRVCAHSVKKGYTHFFYGGDVGVPEILKEKVEARFPGIQVVGTHSPPFRPLTAEEDAAIVERIQSLSPTFVWVGISTPKQERWMYEHHGRLGRSILLGVGAVFDLHAGLKTRAPKWIQSAGLEWLYRVCREPRRLGRRYLTTVPTFIYYSLLHFVGLYKTKAI
jgi:N-acetylglucosaminyldiphosphoundecaprenol N-acetyl-beta-D-mannosaminyltransferase